MVKERLIAEGFREIDRAAQPVGVYCLLWRGEVVYVGQSVSVYRRIAEHHWAKGRKRPLLNVVSHDTRNIAISFDAVLVRWCGKDDLDRIEEELIRRFEPKHNIIVREELPKMPVDLAALGLERNSPGSFRRRKVA